MMVADQKERIYGLDILRCMAILFVLFSHSSYLLPVSEKAKEFFLVYFGFTGVEIFFVLSGFLVGRIFLNLLAKNPFTFSMIRHFWIRRWFRTLPTYYLALLLTAGMIYFMFHSFVFSEPYNLLFLVFLQNFVKWGSSFFGHGWSLSVEEWFYLLLPAWVAIFFLFARIRNKPLAGILTCIFAITLLRIVVVLLYDPKWNSSVRALVPLRLDSLMIGVLCAYIYIHYRDYWKKYAGICFAAGVIITLLASVWLYFDVIRDPATAGFFSKTFFFNVFTTGIACCMPYMSGIAKANNRWIGASVTHISIISYSLYLFHIMMMYVYLILVYKFSLAGSLLVKFGGSWVACIIGASIIYRYYEKPFTNLRDRFKPKKQ